MEMRMTEYIQTTQPLSLDFSAARLKGRMRAALICGTFGAVWMIQALYFGNNNVPACLAAVSALSAIFIVWPIVRLRSLRHLPISAADKTFWPSVARPYWTLVIIEWLLCAIAINGLLYIHRYRLMPEALGIIIGLHFLPLARIFKAPIYYATGAIMVLGALSVLLLPVGPFRNLAACSVNGLTLWATASIILLQDWFESPQPQGIPLAG
jgi:hypothetical protein